MKKLISILLLAAAFASSAAPPPVLRNLVTTNRFAPLGPYDIRLFGAIPDDTIEDDAAIQAAINACSTNVEIKSVRGTVWIPEGIFLIGTNNPPAADSYLEGHASNLIIRSNGVVLRGVNRHRSILKLNKDTTGSALYYGNMIGMGVTNPAAPSSYSGVTNCGIKNLTIDGNNLGITSGNSVDLTQIYLSAQIEIEDVDFYNSSQDAVDVQFGDASFVRRCNFYNIRGNAIGSQDRLTIAQDLYGNGNQGGNPPACFTASVGTLVLRNVVWENMSGIAVIDGGGTLDVGDAEFYPTNTTAFTNIIAANGNVKLNGVYISGAAAIAADHYFVYLGTNKVGQFSNVETYGKRAFYIDSATTADFNNVRFYQNTQPSIVFNGGFGYTVSGSVFSGSGRGIENNGVGSSSVSVTDTKFYGTSIYATPASGSATNWNVSGCTFSGGALIYMNGNSVGHANISANILDTVNLTSRSNLISACKINTYTFDSSVGSGNVFQNCRFENTTYSGSALAHSNTVFIDCLTQGGNRFNPFETYFYTNAAVTLGGYPGQVWASAVIISNTAGTVTLPTAVNYSGFGFSVKNAHAANALTVATTSSQTVDSTTPATIPANGFRRYFSDGSNWFTQ